MQLTPSQHPPLKPNAAEGKGGDGAVTPNHPGRRQCRNPYPSLVMEYTFKDNLVALAVSLLQI